VSVKSDTPDGARRRLDQWLWVARFAKSRSLAARLCAGGAIIVNGVVVAKPNHTVRAGDVVTVPQGPWQRTVRVVGLGTRRGSAPEASLLFEEELAATRRRDTEPVWEPLLLGEASDD
jgi:ribosome-associated heat shock protein Hsp15